MEIPRRIFQTWKSHTIENPVLLSWQNSWKTLNPTFQYELWDDDDNRAFVKENFPDFLTVYDSYTKTIHRVDAIRYLYLYKFGGIYADLDFECIRPFEPILKQLDEQGVDVCLGQLDIRNENVNHSVPNAIMISRAGVHFWEFVIEALSKTRIFDLYPELQTGPIFLKLCLSTYLTGNYDKMRVEEIFGNDIFSHTRWCIKPSKIIITDQDIFYPVNWTDKESHTKYLTTLYSPDVLRQTFPNSYAITYWMHSW